MATIHSKLPKHRGELEVATSLRECGYDELHLWFSLDYIPGVRDVDLFLIEPTIGALCIEIKAITLSMIEEITYQRWTISGREPDSGPIRQAYNASFGLRQYLHSRVKNVPFIVATACFSKITRVEWNEAFRATEFGGEFAEQLIFYDDLSSGASVLKSRLGHIYLNPPIRAGHGSATRRADRLYIVRQSQIDEIEQALDPKARPTPTPTDYERLITIEKGITGDLKKSYPLDDVHFMVFSGLPGTGKTFRLLQLLLLHAYSGNRVLFCCYNKTLAADIRRLLSFIDALKAVHEHPLVVDIFDLAVRDFTELGIGYVNSSGHDEWLSLVVTDLRKSQQRGALASYDLVLVDEAQELSPSERELLLLHLDPGGSLFFVLAREQEIYGERTPFDKAAAKILFSSLDASVQPKAREFRRNFRNTQDVYLAGHLFYSCYPDDEKIGLALAEFDKRRTKQLDLDFDRPTGGSVELFVVDDSGLPSPGDHAYPMLQEQVMVTTYYEHILREINSLNEREQPVDILILVPTEKSINTEWARQALTKIHGDLSIESLDLTIETNRRLLPASEKIRLCTFHSSRGLEGSRVIVFGMDQIEQLSKKLNFAVENLGFIVLTRSVFSTVLVFSNNSSKIKRFMEKISLQLTTRRGNQKMLL